jgi:hypothetical protein
VDFDNSGASQVQRGQERVTITHPPFHSLAFNCSAVGTLHYRKSLSFLDRCYRHLPYSIWKMHPELPTSCAYTRSSWPASRIPCRNGKDMTCSIQVHKRHLIYSSSPDETLSCGQVCGRPDISPPAGSHGMQGIFGIHEKHPKSPSRRQTSAIICNCYQDLTCTVLDSHGSRK